MLYHSIQQIGVCCVANPSYVRFDTGLTKPKFGILGSDIAGHVEAVGTNVTQFHVGDEVYGDIGRGGFAEYVVTTEDKLSFKPANLSFVEAAAVPKAGNTALQSVHDFGQVKASNSVLIKGASGGIGTFAIQIAKSAGAKVTAVNGKHDIELVRSLGADHIIDYTVSDFADGQHQYDLILDLVGNRTVNDYQRTLKPDGTALIVGFTTMGHMIGAIVKGMWASKKSTQIIKPMDAVITQAHLNDLKARVESGELKPIIDRSYEFDQIPEAMRYIETGHARGKVVVRSGVN